MKIIIVSDDLGHRGGAGHIAKIEYELICGYVEANNSDVRAISALAPNYSMCKKISQIIIGNFLILFYALNKENIFIVHTWSYLPFVAFVRSSNRMFVQHDYLLICPAKSLYNSNTGKKCTIRGYSAACLAQNCGYSKKKKLFNYFFAKILISKVNIRYLSETGKRVTQNFSRLSSMKIAFSKLAPNIQTERLEILEKYVRKKPLNNKRLLFVGRYSFDKGYDRYLTLKVDEYKLYSCGSGKINPNARVCDLGWLDSKSYLKEISNATALFYPSRQLDADPIIVKICCFIGVPVFISADNAAAAYVERVFGEKFLVTDWSLVDDVFIHNAVINLDWKRVELGDLYAKTDDIMDFYLSSLTRL